MLIDYFVSHEMCFITRVFVFLDPCEVIHNWCLKQDVQHTALRVEAYNGRGCMEATCCFINNPADLWRLSRNNEIST